MVTADFRRTWRDGAGIADVPERKTANWAAINKRGSKRHCVFAVGGKSAVGNRPSPSHFRALVPCHEGVRVFLDSLLLHAASHARIGFQGRRFEGVSHFPWAGQHTQVRSQADNSRCWKLCRYTRRWQCLGASNEQLRARPIPVRQVVSLVPPEVPPIADDGAR